MHSAIIVIGDVESNLAPYSDSDENYFEFQDETEEHTSYYQTGTVKALVHEGINQLVYNLPAELQSQAKEMPVKEFYPTFEDYLEYCGKKEEDGRIGYHCNPDARYDWYSVGGRWERMIPLKEPYKKPDGEMVFYVNSAIVGEIDLLEFFSITGNLAQVASAIVTPSDGWIDAEKDVQWRKTLYDIFKELPATEIISIVDIHN